MLLPLGFVTKSANTRLGKMVYDTASPETFLPPEIAPAPADAPPNPLTMVFLHGFGGGSSAYEWSRVYPAFANEYQILAPDLIGWGRSEHPVRNYVATDYVDTIEDFLQQTLTEPAIVVASSLTAAFTIRVAIAQPQLFRALILTSPAGLSDFGDDYSRSFFAQLVSTPILGEALYRFGIATSNGIRNFMEQRQFAHARRVCPEMVEAYLLSAQQTNAEYSALAFVRGDLCFDLADYIDQLTIPTAILWGRQAQFTGPDIGRQLAKRNPSAIRVFQQLEQVGLTPQLELPEVTIGLIRRYLSQLL
jgi:pimeloyl-ACP methyl ester carboxylesterase